MKQFLDKIKVTYDRSEVQYYYRSLHASLFPSYNVSSVGYFYLPLIIYIPLPRSAATT